jgi:hypothetical protein
VSLRTTSQARSAVLAGQNPPFSALLAVSLRTPSKARSAVLAGQRPPFSALLAVSLRTPSKARSAVLAGQRPPFSALLAVSLRTTSKARSAVLAGQSPPFSRNSKRSVLAFSVWHCFNEPFNQYGQGFRLEFSLFVYQIGLPRWELIISKNLDEIHLWSH